jgi:tripartite-type tricarboxylate transporter receptor subunit TctC
MKPAPIMPVTLRAPLPITARIQAAPLLLAALLGSAALPALAQQWPVKPIRVITPFTAGSAVDTIARVLGQQLAEQLGQPVVIDNRTGANGIIGAEAAVKSPADGYTLLLANDAILATNPAMYAKLPYDPQRDLVPITLVSSVPLILVAHPSLPVKSVKELVALARSRPAQINFASGGSGSAQHLPMELLQSLGGVKLVHVPYKGLGPALQDVMGGHVPVMFAGMSNVVPFARENKVRLLAISTAKRSPALPDVPTVAESGLPGFAYAAWNGFLAPAGTPPAIVKRLHAEIGKALAAAEVRAKLAPLGFELIGAGPEEFAALIRSDGERIGRIVRDAGIKAE